MTKVRVSAVTSLDTETAGIYTYHEEHLHKPTYKHVSKDLYLWWDGWWKVDNGDWYSSDKANPLGFIRSEEDVGCPELVGSGKWKYYDDDMPHSAITVEQGRSRFISISPLLVFGFLNTYYSLYQCDTS